MSRSMGSVSIAALLAVSMFLPGCISSTTVYEDEDSTPATTVKTPKAPTKTSAKTTKKTTTPKDPVVIVHEHRYYYYPSRQVYRDCETNYWFWNEAGIWQVSATLPKTKSVGNEEPYMIVMKGDSPKDEHEVVVRTHPAKRAKSLPPQANGIAKGHQKQNARAELQVESNGDAESGATLNDPALAVIEVEDDVEQPALTAEAKPAKGISNGHGKDKDKEKPQKKERNSDKGKGKKD